MDSRLTCTKLYNNYRTRVYTSTHTFFVAWYMGYGSMALGLGAPGTDIRTIWRIAHAQFPTWFLCDRPGPACMHAMANMATVSSINAIPEQLLKNWSSKWRDDG